MGPGTVVQTVRGPIAPEALGVTPALEHLWMDARPLLAVHGPVLTEIGVGEAAIRRMLVENPARLLAVLH
jgi:predicted metal-dependent phosphotriesterase family hydrolase